MVPDCGNPSIWYECENNAQDNRKLSGCRVIPESTVCLHQGHDNLTQYDTTRGFLFQRMKSGLLGHISLSEVLRRANTKESSQNKLCTDFD
ncbi:hypothetical protein FXW07_16925 [Methanosarcina sp. DH1]|uniref:hypothetical protein n=1 Tax=Methanosarcina sp. DH1 TaxID=2605695 RepID=UPI001E5BEC96|nr:hypothetical protein [Methanosarcina sp. DH1]MCC4768236.1 hypothetical protein [Methanosarcina sp. DH1]